MIDDQPYLQPFVSTMEKRRRSEKPQSLALAQRRTQSELSDKFLSNYEYDDKVSTYFHKKELLQKKENRDIKRKSKLSIEVTRHNRKRYSLLKQQGDKIYGNDSQTNLSVSPERSSGAT